MPKDKIKTSEKFLQKLVESQGPLPRQLNNLETLSQRIEQTLKQNILEDIKFYYGGSKVRDTLLKENFDLNVVIYWPLNTVREIKDIHGIVGKALRKKWKKARPKSLGWEIPYKDNFHIDVMPGILTDEKTHHAIFYDTKTDKDIETSIKIHDEHIRNSERTNIIRLMKLWKIRRNIPINTFLLELMSIEGCRGINRTQVEKQTKRTFDYIKNSILTKKVSDPANSKNFISDSMNNDEKQRIQKLITQSIEEKTWNKVFKH